MKHLVMFDIDGTLTESHEFDGQCYKQAVDEILQIDSGNDWSHYTHVTDTGVLSEILERHNIDVRLERVIDKVKHRFFELCQQHLHEHGLHEIAGAGQFFNQLKLHNKIQLAIATGGWRQSAEMKLDSAGIEYTNIPFASSDDAMTRIDIMQAAANKTNDTNFLSKCYFGDGEWDKKACQALDYRFIAIGPKVSHLEHHDDFRSINIDEFVNSLESST